MIKNASKEMLVGLQGIFYILRQKFSISEIFLNLLFIALVIIISMIIYWDTINSRVAATSRCKRQMDIYNKNKGIYVVNATDKSKNPLFTIEYDTNQFNTNVECKCPSGKYINTFGPISVKNMKTNIDTKVEKTCTCDKYYNVGLQNENILYDGEPGVVRYMTSNDSDFFDNLIYSPYS